MNRNRLSARYPGYNYSDPGTYFVTLVAFDREEIFSIVEGGDVILLDIGAIVIEEFHRTVELRANVVPDAYVVMPNHI